MGTACGVGVLGWALTASAENIQHFEPAAGVTGGFSLEDHRTPGHLRLITDLYVNYGREPLVVVDASGKNEQQIVGHMTTMDVIAGLTFLDRVLLAIDVPIDHLLGDGAAKEEQEGFILGDLRLLTRVRLFGGGGAGDEGLGLAVAVPVSFPTGNQYGHTSTGAIGFNPKLIVGWDFGGLDAYTNLGARASTASETIDGTDTKVGSALTYTAGAGYELGTVRLLGEVFGSVPFEDAAKKTTTNPLEALAGVRWAFGHGLHLNAGAGLGIIGDAGTPAFRMLAGLGFVSGDAGDDGGRSVAPEAEVAEDTTNHAAEAEAAAAAAEAAPEPVYAEAGEVEAEAAERARAETAQAVAARRQAVAEAEADAEARRRQQAEAVAAARAAAEDEEPPPNHGKKRRDARPEPEPEPDAEEAAPPPKKKRPQAEAAGDALEVRRAPPGRVLALGQVPAGAVKKGGHKKRASLYFAEGSTTLDRRATAELAQLARLFEKAPDEADLRLSGHADDLAASDVSLKQSRARAKAAKAWLVEHGVPGKRIVLEWYGDTAPIGKNKTEAGRSVNRRVDYAFVVFEE